MEAKGRLGKEAQKLLIALQSANAVNNFFVNSSSTYHLVSVRA
jgi:hypothetical protein